MAALIGRLLDEYRTFNFFQAISLLEEKFLGESGITEPLDAGKIRLHGDCTTVFPPNDISEIRRKEDSVHLVLSFMGLTGVSSPLPYYFAEYIEQRPEMAKALRDFMNIFDHRLYSLFYRAWKKYHFMRNFTPDGTDPFSRKAAALAGINPQLLPAGRNARLLAYTGIFAGTCRSVAGLETFLSDYFNNISLTVRQWVPRWAEITDTAPLGPGARLGVNMIAGNRILDISGKIRVIAGPLGRKVYETFLPGSENIAVMKKLVRIYLIDPLDFDIEVRLQSIELTPAVLGARNAGLGETSSLGQTNVMSGMQSVIISG